MCDPGQPGLNLADCYTRGVTSQDTVQSLFDSPAALVNLIVEALFVFSGIILLGMIIYAGFLYIQDTSKGKDQAKDILTKALAGFVLMFSAYWIVQIVSAITGIDSIL